MGSVHMTSAPSPAILLLHIGQGSPLSTILMNSDRMAMNRHEGQRVKSSFVTCIPYTHHDPKFEILHYAD